MNGMGVILPNGNQIPMPSFASANSAFHPFQPMIATPVPLPVPLPVINPLVFNGTGLFNMSFNPYANINLPTDFSALPVIGQFGGEVEEDTDINVVDIDEEDNSRNIKHRFALAEIERKNAESVVNYRNTMDYLFTNWESIRATAVQVPQIRNPFGYGPDDIVPTNLDPNVKPIFASCARLPLPVVSPFVRSRARTPGRAPPRNESDARRRGYNENWRPWYARGNRDPLRYPPGMEEYLEKYDGYQGRHPRADQYPKHFTNALIGYCEDEFWSKRTVPLPRGVHIPPRPLDYFKIRSMTPPPEDFDYIPPAGELGLHIPIEALILREGRRREMEAREKAKKMRIQKKKAEAAKKRMQNI